ncbi:MAG: class IIb bacteriocin, lactobin A/cerein 7B family [Mariniphaga sp.]|nr:class IIb bacteriocin, lactobin A/cerein 7B family [Mariniphaga sp.]
MENLLDFKMPGVIELGKEELQEVEGGGILAAVAGFVGAALLGAATVEVLIEGSAQCWEDFKEGYRSTQ